MEHLDLLIVFLSTIENTLIQLETVFRITCETCKNAIQASKEDGPSSQLISRHEIKKLTRPNTEVVKVVKIAHAVLEEEKKKSEDVLSKQFLFQKLSIRVLAVIIGQFSFLLKSLCHRRDIIKTIAHLYFTLKLKHMCKLRNDRANSLCRHKNKKKCII